MKLVLSKRLDRRTLAVVLAGFCAFLDLYAPQPLLPMLGQVFHASKLAVSLTITASTVGVALAAPLIGSLADYLGRKRVIVPATFLLVLPTVLAACSANLPQLVFWRFVQGVFTPGIFAVTVAYIHEEWVDGGAGAAMASYVTGTVIGGFTGRLTAGVVATHLGWRWAFLVLAGLNVLGALAIWAWLPQGKGFVPAGRVLASVASMLDHLCNRRLLATYTVGFCVLFSLLGMFTYVTFHLAAPPFHLGATALASIFFVYLVGAVVTPMAGRWIDRHGHRTALAAAVAIGVLGVLATLAPQLWIVVAGLAICSTGVFIAQSAASSYIGTAAEHGRASAVGLYVTFYYVGGSAGAAVPGFVWALGGWTACVLLIAAVQILTVGIALLFWK